VPRDPDLFVIGHLNEKNWSLPSIQWHVDLNNNGMIVNPFFSSSLTHTHKNTHFLKYTHTNTKTNTHSLK
jgi:hypothetical protein